MSTWSSKGPLAALGLVFLSGCGDAGFPFGAMPDQATRAELAHGAVTIQAPPGYCIDKQALRRAPRGDFALLARCDTLGIRDFFPKRRLALLTVTTAPQGTDALQPDLADLEQSVAPAEVIEATMMDDLPMVRLENPDSPAEGIAPQHWRCAFALNGQLVALALYAPESDADTGAAGPELLADLAHRTALASAPVESPTAPEPEAISTNTPGDMPEGAPSKEGFSPLQLFGAIGDLFE